MALSSITSWLATRVLGDAHTRLGGVTRSDAVPNLPVFGPRPLLNDVQQAKFGAATQTYEPFLNAQALSIHQRNRTNVAVAMQAAVEALPRDVQPDEFSTIIGGNLMEILKVAGFDPTPYIPKDVNDPQGYGKYLLYTDAVAASPYCLQIFAFGANQSTVVHNHPTNCTSLVVEGTLDEFLYEFNDNEPVMMEQIDRPVGSVGHLRISQSNIHSLSVPSQPPANAASTRCAMTVHLYFIDGVVKPAGVKERWPI